MAVVAHLAFRFIVLLVGVALLSGCIGSGSADPATAELPDWLARVYPEPGAELTATQAVQVDHDTLAADREVRLSIDGTDVTTYARIGPSTLEYDIDQTAAPVDLKPGSHTATVELYSVKAGASEGVESYSASERNLLDTFTWEFTVL